MPLDTPPPASAWISNICSLDKISKNSHLRLLFQKKKKILTLDLHLQYMYTLVLFLSFHFSQIKWQSTSMCFVCSWYVGDLKLYETQIKLPFNIAFSEKKKSATWSSIHAYSSCISFFPLFTNKVTVNFNGLCMFLVHRRFKTLKRVLILSKYRAIGASLANPNSFSKFLNHNNLHVADTTQVDDVIT